ncbi:MAG: hypothetical protein EP332_07010 [Bacteroidetes bacterium]|nr:MAG: hypothetical protein EP332_07010 [Bacteroidota bacterium]
MKRLLLLTVCLLSGYFIQAQVAEPQINQGSGSKPRPVVTQKKAEVIVTWKGSETHHFVIEALKTKEEKDLILKSGESGSISMTAGYVQIRSKHKGTTYYSAPFELDPGQGTLILTISGKDILIRYESEAEIKEKQKQAEAARQAEEKRREEENRRKANQYIDKANSYISSGNCDNAQSAYNSATTFISKNEPSMIRLQRSIESCRSSNAYEVAIYQAENYKRKGDLTQALSSYRSALSHKSGDSEANKQIKAVQNDMDRASSLESQADALVKKGEYTKAYNNYYSAYDLWKAKEGLYSKLNDTYYLMNKDLGKKAMDRGDYEQALEYFTKAKTIFKGKTDGEIKNWEKEASYEINKAKGEEAMDIGDYYNAYSYFNKAKSFKETSEVQRLEREALNKTFDTEWSELVRNDNVQSYEKFLKRWTKLPAEKESYVYKRLYELEFEQGRKRFIANRTGYVNLSNAQKWLEKYDPSKKLMEDRRLLRSYMNYETEPQGFSISYSLPVMLGYSETDTREDFRDVNTAALPFQAPQETNILRSGFFFFNRLNGSGSYNSDIIVPLGKRFLALPYSFNLGYQNILTENAGVDGLYDDQSDSYSALNNYSVYKDSIKAAKGENAWLYRNLSLSGSIGYKFVNQRLNLNFHLQYNIAAMSYNPYETCVECGNGMDYSRNFLSAGISLNWKDRWIFSYTGLNGLVRSDVASPENTAKQASLEIRFGEADDMTRFSLVGQWFNVKTYQLLAPGQDPINNLSQIRLFPTFTFRF